MKKQYINPDMNIMHVETTSMIAASDTITFNNSGEGEVIVQNDNATGAAMSHSSSIWDEEE